MCLTNGADDASVTGHSWWRVDVQQSQMLKESVCHGSMHLLVVHDA